MKFILGQKISMTQVFLDNGEVVPVTRIKAGPCPVVQIKKTGKQPQSVQLGFGEKKAYRLEKPVAGHLKDLSPVRWLKEIPTTAPESMERGDMVTVGIFAQGEKVDVIGTSKGKGFAGVVKRYHFRGGPASHGHKDNLRARGSSGAGGVQRVFKGMRMAGRMGGAQVTVKNLEIVKIDSALDEIYIKGAVPGATNGFIVITAPGELTATKKQITE